MSGSLKNISFRSIGISMPQLQEDKRKATGISILIIVLLILLSAVIVNIGNFFLANQFTIKQNILNSNSI